MGKKAKAATKPEDDDDEAGILAAAAAAWASKQSTEKANKNETKAAPHKGQTKVQIQPTSSAQMIATLNHKNTQSLSVHVTQLDFDATEFHIRQHWVSHGIFGIAAVRLVYDRSVHDKKLFRGVAFVDCTDADSYRAALKLHGSKLLGRRINVRPVKSKKELAAIVTKTKEKVRSMVQQSMESKGNKGTKPKKHQAPVKPEAKKAAAGKLSKKDRNRRAAILKNRKS